MKKMKPPITAQRSTKAGTDKHKGDTPTTPQRKGSAGQVGKPLSKTYISKSHDNLASQLRRKAAAANLASPRPGSTASLGKREGNKENGHPKGVTGTKFKSPKPQPGPLTKASSAQNINQSESPMKRAQSVQLIDQSGATVSTMSKGNLNPASVKRAQSTQNISKDRSGSRQRISAPVNALAYNAELLASFEKEKKILERRISELIQMGENRLAETEKLKFEIRNLKEMIPPANYQDTIEMLQNENKLLKDRLQELGVNVEHTTDNEKLFQLHKEKDGQSSDSVQGAFGGSDFDETKIHDRATLDTDLGISVGDLTCMTPDHPSSLSLDNGNWDRQSNKSSDAQSDVACLQDRILQMEETNYSTNEELQATLQELGDLQDAVNTLTTENECLTDEKMVLLESLCAQTEKLENARMQIEHLKALMVRESETGDRSENERQLVALLKSAQEERDELYLKQTEYTNSMHSFDNENKELQDIIQAQRDKIQLLEMKNESLLSDKRQMETNINELKETDAKEQIEIQRYKTLLENEKSKVAELEQVKNAEDKSEIEALLDNARQEKDKVESKLTNTLEELAFSKNEVCKLKEQMCSLEEELKVSKNNAKTMVSDLEYKLDQKDVEKKEVQDEIKALREQIDRLKLDCERHVEEKQVINSTVSDLETQLSNTKQKVRELQSEVQETKQKMMEEQEEWRQFQSDLQVAVVVANEIKTEAQEEQEKLVLDYSSMKERTATLEAECEMLRAELDKFKQKEDIRSDLRGRVISTVDKELQALRHGRKISDVKGGNQSSVKNLIASIECQVKVKGTTPPVSPSIGSNESSRRNSTESVLSITKENVLATPDRRSSTPAESEFKSLLRKQPQENRAPLNHRHTVSTYLLDNSSIPTMTNPEPTKATTPVKAESETVKKPQKSILSNKRRSTSQ